MVLLLLLETMFRLMLPLLPSMVLRVVLLLPLIILLFFPAQAKVLLPAGCLPPLDLP
jgi:hypothetical protein